MVEKWLISNLVLRSYLAPDFGSVKVPVADRLVQSWTWMVSL